MSHSQNTSTHNKPPSAIVNYHTKPSSTLLPPTVSNPTYIESSASLSEPITPFHGLDHKYTPEEDLQHIETPVTFSRVLQPSTKHEYKFCHARLSYTAL